MQVSPHLFVFSSSHCPKNNLSLCIKTEPVTVRADAMVYVWLFFNKYISGPGTPSCTLCQNDLSLCIKTKPVTVGADSRVYVWLLFTVGADVQRIPHSVASAPAGKGSRFWAEIQITFGTVWSDQLHLALGEKYVIIFWLSLVMIRLD